MMQQRLRGDNDITSLMDDWDHQKQQQLPVTTNDVSTRKVSISKPTNSIITKPKRLLPELREYPNNLCKAGSLSIWNPYVQQQQQAIKNGNSDKSRSFLQSYTISTNPQVEVLRRRIYETFKNKCCDYLHNIIKEWSSTTTTTNLTAATTAPLTTTTTKMMMKMPSLQALLEKWHMDSKQDETNRWRQWREKQRRQNKNRKNCKELTTYPTITDNCHLIHVWTKGQMLRQHRDGDVDNDDNNHDSSNPISADCNIDDYDGYYDPLLLHPSASFSFPLLLEHELERIRKLKQQPSNLSSLDNNNKDPVHNDPPHVVKGKRKRVRKTLLHAILNSRESFYKGLFQLSQREIIKKQQQQSSQQSSSFRRRKKGNDNNHHLIGEGGRDEKGLPRITRIIPPNRNDGGDHNSNEYKMNNNNNNNDDDVREDNDAMMQVTYAGNTFKIHDAYYNKLQRLYDRTVVRYCDDDNNHSNRIFSIDQQQSYPTFEESLFCLLCRYDTLQGAGLQAGVPGAVMDVLLEKFDCRMECFASTFNCRYENYGSAYDLDFIFGSKGDFFGWFEKEGDETEEEEKKSVSPMEGCYQANPPFCEGVINALGERMKILLKGGDRNDNDSNINSPPLMFIVFVPQWKHSQAYNNLIQHPYLTNHIHYKAEECYYCEGTRYRRKYSYRQASFGTDVLFYQNDQAKKKWPMTNINDSDTDSICGDNGVVNNNEALRLALGTAFMWDPVAEKEKRVEDIASVQGPSMMMAKRTEHVIGVETSAVNNNNVKFNVNDVNAPSYTTIETTSRINESTKRMEKRKKNGGCSKNDRKIIGSNEMNRTSKKNGGGARGKKKRKTFVNRDEERKAQLELLGSLGLSSLSSSSCRDNDSDKGGDKIDGGGTTASNTANSRPGINKKKGCGRRKNERGMGKK